jgi:hypothetical protein
MRSVRQREGSTLSITLILVALVLGGLFIFHEMQTPSPKQSVAISSPSDLTPSTANDDLYLILNTFLAYRSQSRRMFRLAAIDISFLSVTELERKAPTEILADHSRVGEDAVTIKPLEGWRDGL